MRDMPYRFKEIEDAKSEVEQMKNNLQYYKNESRKSREIKRINTFIRLINAAERLVEASPDREIVDTMLLYVFGLEYDRVQNDGTDGFVDSLILNYKRRVLASELVKGSEHMKSQLAGKIAADMLANSEFLSEEEKSVAVHESEKVTHLMIDATAFWEEQLEKVVEYCHSERAGVWKN